MNEESSPEAAEKLAGALRLLDRFPPKDYVREWTDRIAADQKIVVAGSHAVLIFRIGPEWLALPAGLCQEVTEEGIVHSLPHRSKGAVAGLVNIRGELLICVALESILGFSAPAPMGEKDGKPRRRSRLLVINRLGSRLVFPVDEVAAVARYQPAALRPLPTTLAEGPAPYTIGLLPWRDRTVGCLDDELLFHTLNRSLG